MLLVRVLYVNLREPLCYKKGENLLLLGIEYNHSLVRVYFMYISQVCKKFFLESSGNKTNINISLVIII